MAGHGHTGAGAADATGRTVTLRLPLACRTGLAVQLPCVRCWALGYNNVIIKFSLITTPVLNYKLILFSIRLHI